MEENLLEMSTEKYSQQGESIELNTSSLDEQEKVTTSLEDIYGYEVLSEAFQKQIDEYEKEKEIENQQCLKYVFTEERKDEVDVAFQVVMNAETKMVVVKDYEDKTMRQDNVITMVGFGVLGAVITSSIWVLIEKKRRGKQKK